jgi:hypothetical protein
MSHAKQASTRRKRSIKAIPTLGAAGLLSLASGASAATSGQTADMAVRSSGLSYEITVCEEEISDVSLATFYIFENERAGTLRRGVRLAQGCGGCGCGCAGGGDEGCSSCSTSTYSVAWPVRRYGNPPSYSTKTAGKYAKATKRRHLPK